MAWSEVRHYAAVMRKGLTIIAAWLLACGVACSDDFEEEPPVEEDPLPPGCAAWCEKAVDCAGVTQEGCEAQCAQQFPEEGGCGDLASAVLTCFEAEWDATCEPPPECVEQVKAFASCTGLGCTPDSGICGADGANNLDCRCAGSCGSPWQFQANCQLEGNQVACNCFLSGPIAPEGALGTVQTTCSAPSDGGGDYCQDDWGCCRAKLLQNP